VAQTRVSETNTILNYVALSFHLIKRFVEKYQWLLLSMKQKWGSEFNGHEVHLFIVCHFKGT